jgi:hypothetical protein
MQISNVFMNVSKGEVAKSSDLQKAFGKTDVAEIVKEVRNILSSMRTKTLTQFFRSLRKAKCKWEKKKGTTTSHLSEKRLPRLSPRNASILPISVHILSV